MIYLDYAANTPPCEEALRVFCDVSRDYIANPNSSHPLGLAADERLRKETERFASLLGVKESEIIYTSGASESNNLAVKGAAEHYRPSGKHIVTTWLEHSSIGGAAESLRERGYEVDYAALDEEGRVDLDDLRDLLRDDTVLCTVCLVDSEIGLVQDIPRIAQVVKGHGRRCLLHVDATQAAGKIPLRLGGADLVTLAPHKFYGPIGIGILIKKEGVLLEPQISGGKSATPYRSGTPALALIASAAEAFARAEEHREERYAFVSGLNCTLREALKKYPRVVFNSPESASRAEAACQAPAASPYIFNFSVPGVPSERMVEEMGKRGICISARSACCAPNTPSRAVYALTGDRRRALSALRVSLSHLTTPGELEAFLKAFDECYGQLAGQASPAGRRPSAGRGTRHGP